MDKNKIKQNENYKLQIQEMLDKRMSKQKEEKKSKETKNDSFAEIYTSGIFIALALKASGTHLGKNLEYVHYDGYTISTTALTLLFILITGPIYALLLYILSVKK